MPYSGSNWLTRLRSSKGFPADQHLNLEQFLTLHNPNQIPDPIPNDPNRNLNPIPPPNPGPNRTRSSAPVNGALDSSITMSDILSELFVMGNPQNVPKKKGVRKQPNPRNCAVSIPPIATPSVSCTNLAFEDEEDDTRRRDLSAFSRTEVTVIDTSVKNWKFEKLLFRRKNVWKVRDKKCKSVINVDRKKRKGSSFDDFRSEKKSKLGDGKRVENEGQGLQHNERVEEVCKRGEDNHVQNLKTSKPNNVNSSVILLKSIPVSKKIGKS
ncbi:uncharacterized protein LOC108228042 isoform X2 [Daucus carota subsp. sativus]|uniref:uncharacterized protein LOC108228042 isoform X2 n=1 Tax=Daucus carota subsp. sativus TaxID=79200 RepID=UPI0007F02E94|nr:PREDICTED: uncharacterized protein LOC108228042 [Daucus carota subsp. sativus]